MDGEIITSGEMRQARDHAADVQTIINNNLALSGPLTPVRDFLDNIGHKDWR